MAGALSFEVVNTKTHPESYLSQIGRPEMDMLIGMLRELELNRKDISTMESAYLDALPQPAGLVLEALQDAVKKPQQREDILKKLSKKVYMTEAAQKEWLQAAQVLAENGRADHPALAGALRAYGTDEALAEYKKAAGPLDQRMQEKGYSFFRLKDEKGRLVALASGNAGLLARGELDEETRKQFRLLNVAVSPANQKKGYGTELIEHIREYAKNEGYDEIVVPLSLHALAKENPVKYATIAQKLGMRAPELREHPSDPLSIEMGLSSQLLQERAQPVEKKYQRYARDVLTALIDAPTASDLAPGNALPYVRYEMSFPSVEDMPEPAGKFTDLVRGKITPEEFHRNSEVHQLAYAISHAVEGAINDGTQQFTVEPMIQPSHSGMGNDVNFFIYSESHATLDELQAYLRAHRQAIMARFNGLCEDRTDLPPRG